MSHFAKHVTGSTRLESSANVTVKTEAPYEFSAYIKGDSIIVMGIDTTKTEFDLKISLPYKVKSGQHLLSTGNDMRELLQLQPIEISEPVDVVTVSLPARSLNTYIFMIDRGSTAIKEQSLTDSSAPKTYYDLHGRRLDHPKGLCIERSADGSAKKVAFPTE